MAQWSARWTPDQKVQVPALAGVICVAFLTLTVPLSTQEYKCIPVGNCEGTLTKCWGVTCNG